MDREILKEELVSLLEKRLQSSGYVFYVEYIFMGRRRYTQLYYSQGRAINRQIIEDDLKKIYPEAQLISFKKADFIPGNPLVVMRESSDHEVSMAQSQLSSAEKNLKTLKKKLGKKEKDIPAWVQAKISDTAHNMDAAATYNEGAAWTKKSGKSESGGLNEKGRKSYERENPGSDLKAPSKKVGNPRRASFCARMKGMKKKLTSAKTASDPDSRINKSLRAWNC